MHAEPSRLDIDLPAERTLAVAGVIDSHTADLLGSSLEELGVHDDVKLDLAGVTFIDSSGLRTIVSTHQALEGAGNRLTLSGPSEAVNRLFDITGLHEHLHID